MGLGVDQSDGEIRLASGFPHDQRRKWEVHLVQFGVHGRSDDPNRGESPTNRGQSVPRDEKGQEDDV
jgi:hypothetical protein